MLLEVLIIRALKEAAGEQRTLSARNKVVGQFLFLYEKITADYSVLIPFLLKIISQAFHMILILLLPLFNHSHPRNKQK